MFSECSNPGCRKGFDFHQGRYFHFRESQRADTRPRNTHGVVHFWLCGRCSQLYALDYVDGHGTIVRANFEQWIGQFSEAAIHRA